MLAPIELSQDQPRSPQLRLGEAVGLAGASTWRSCAPRRCPCASGVPATLLGRRQGRRDRAGLGRAVPVELVVVDAALTPVQQRNLEKPLEDQGHRPDRPDPRDLRRAGASTREGTLQVELAALRYQRSRLVRSWTHLERQRGGFGFRRRPGRDPARARPAADRRAHRRIASRARGGQAHPRAASCRTRRACLIRCVALVGYTNAGKSTLFNRMTGAAVGGARSAVRDARPDHAPRRAALGRQGDPVGHGRASSPICRRRWWRRSAPRSRRCWRRT